MNWKLGAKSGWTAYAAEMFGSPSGVPTNWVTGSVAVSRICTYGEPLPVLSNAVRMRPSPEIPPKSSLKFGSFQFSSDSRYRSSVMLFAGVLLALVIVYVCVSVDR